MVDWSLASSPLSVRIGHGRVLGKNTGNGPVEEVRVVDKSLGVEGMVIQDQRTVVSETTADTPDDEVDNPEVGQSDSHVEVLDGELTDEEETKKDTSLSTSSVVGPVEVGLVSRSSDHAQIVLREPAGKNGEVMSGLGGPLELALFKDVLRDTESDKFTILDVVGGLGIDTSSHSVIVGIL